MGLLVRAAARRTGKQKECLAVCVESCCQAPVQRSDLAPHEQEWPPIRGRVNMDLRLVRGAEWRGFQYHGPRRGGGAVLVGARVELARRPAAASLDVVDGRAAAHARGAARRARVDGRGHPRSDGSRPSRPPGSSRRAHRTAPPSGNTVPSSTPFTIRTSVGALLSTTLLRNTCPCRCCRTPRSRSARRRRCRCSPRGCWRWWSSRSRGGPGRSRDRRDRCRRCR